MGGVVAPALVRVPHLYHFTNVNNLPGIRRLGGIFSTARLNAMGELFCSGGDEASLVLDRQCGMDQFVHLCFTAGHPMAFRVRERSPNVNLTYLRIDRTILAQPGVMFATGVGHANNAETTTLDDAVARNLIDYHALYDWTDWADAEAQAKRHAAEMCEILIPDHVAVALIRNLPNG
jgi:hypothetical protein